jgi:polar amino acid transport system substrate-binding protein
MRSSTTIISAAIIAVIAAYATVKIAIPHDTHTEVKKESAFDRVMRTGMIRCGYIPYAPYFMKDTNTGKLSGIFYELTEEMAKTLSLKVDWSYETTFATYSQDAKNGRFDVYCAGLWAVPDDARNVDYTNPVNFVGLGVYVRADDNRFDGNIGLLNDKQYKFATVDGEMSDIVAKQDFSNAQTISHPNNTEVSQLALDLTTKKADAMVVEKAVADEYLVKNPGSLKNIAIDKPIRLFGTVWAVPKGEWNLISMFNTTIDEMVNSGFAEKVVAKYEKTPGSFYPKAVPFNRGNK